MAKFYKHAGVIGLRKSAAEELLLPIPAGATDVIAFDESSNAAVIAAFDADCNSHSLSGGVLRKNGSPVAFAADSADKQDREGLLSEASQAVADNQAFLAIGSPTNAQTLAQVKALSRQNNRIIKRLIQFTRG